MNNANRKNWADAKAYCTALTLGTHSDWYLPTQEELLTILDRTKSGTKIDATFQSTSSGNYWSSSVSACDSSSAWFVRFYSGYSSYDSQSSARAVRCTRKY